MRATIRLYIADYLGGRIDEKLFLHRSQGCRRTPAPRTGYGGFDRVAAAAVKRLKQKYPDITLMLVLPYHPAERPTEAPDGFDGTYHPDGLESTPKRYAIVRANKIMVDTCEWLVCYVRHGAGNSRKLLEYAQRRAARGLIQIENIGENESGE